MIAGAVCILKHHMHKVEMKTERKKEWKNIKISQKRKEKRKPTFLPRRNWFARRQNVYNISKSAIWYVLNVWISNDNHHYYYRVEVKTKQGILYTTSIFSVLPDILFDFAWEPKLWSLGTDTSRQRGLTLPNNCKTKQKCLLLNFKL